MPTRNPGEFINEGIPGAKAGRGDYGRIEPILIAGFAAALAVPILYIFRRFDGNTLVSWRWVFAEGGIQTVYPYIISGTLLCYLPARLNIKGRNILFPVIAASFLLLTSLYSEPEIILDAGRYFLQAKHLKEYGPVYFLREWGREISAWTDLPLVPFIYGLVMRLLGEVRLYIQIVNTIMFCLTLACTWRIGKMLWGREAGNLGILMLLGIPYLLIQVPLMLVDVCAMFFLAASILSVLEAAERGGVSRNLAVGLAVFLALISKYSIWVMILMIPSMYLVHRSQNREVSIYRVLPGLGIAASMFLAFVIINLDTVGPQFGLLAGYQMAGLGRWKEGPASTFLFQIHPFVSGFVIYSIYHGIKRREAHVIPALLVLLIVVIFRAWRIRYLIPLLPVLALLAARGIGYLKYSVLRRYIGFTTAFCSMAIVFTAYLPFVKSSSLMNLKLAGEFLNVSGNENIVVHTLPQRSSTGSTAPAVAILDIYADGVIIHAEPWAKPGLSPDVDDSSLRFTWELKKPYFYKAYFDGSTDSSTIIYSHMDDLSDYVAEHTDTSGQGDRFDRTEGVFRYKTLVTVYNRRSPNLDYKD